MLFSYRKRIKKMRDKLQIDFLDENSRNVIWSVLHTCYWSKISRSYSTTGYDHRAVYFLEQQGNERFRLFFSALWIRHFKRPIDTLKDDWDFFHVEIRRHFFQCEWNEVYDFLEFVVSTVADERLNEAFIKACNHIFEDESIAYRFVGKKITDITDNIEIEEVESVLQSSSRAIRSHIDSALNKLCEKKNPDYRNSIKESISAVEAICRLISKNEKATLGDALKIVNKNSQLHPAFKSAIDKLYGYSSDEQGIRHSLIDKSTATFEEAKFMLVASSAFVNYLIAKAGKLRIEV